jgi:hypothetical protein
LRHYVGDAVAPGVVAPLQLGDLVPLAQAFDFDGDIGHQNFGLRIAK